MTTDRLRLRPFTAEDADALVALDNDPEVLRFINGGKPVSAEVIRGRTLPRLCRTHPVSGRPDYWAAEARDSGDFLGWFEFRPLTEESVAEVELGYRLARRAWGGGLATEGALALVERGFAGWAVTRIEARTMAVNTRSRRVMEKVGLRFSRAYSGDWPEAIPGSEHGEVAYELTREEWLASH
ncbi:GNAT family N-acetyltransferase [Streptomyces chisholmiae]|nr:GNAT family N-acetyltransferase [Streptomyces sp. DSM 44915]